MSGNLKEFINYIARGISPSYDSEGIIVLNQKCIRNQKVSLEEARIHNIYKKSVSHDKILNNYDVLINSTGVGTLGRVAQVKNIKDKMTVDSHITIVRPNLEKIDGEFFGYCIKVQEGFIETLGTGATGQTELSRDAILDNVMIPQYSKKNQQKIAKILSNYDDLIENNSKRIKILEEMAQKIYKEWFIDFKYPGHETTTFKDTELGKIPSDWEVKKVSDISVLYKGKSYKSSELVEDKKGLPFLNLKCIERKGGFRRDGLKWFDGKYSDNHIVYPEDIIMAVTDLTQERLIVARPARIPHNWYEKYVMSMDLVKLKPKDNIDISYFYSLLKYSNFSEEVKNHANGANVLHLNPQNIEMYKLVVASEKVRNQFGKIVNQIYNNIDVLYLKNEMLVQTRDLLLPRLMSGEINVENLEIA